LNPLERVLVHTGIYMEIPYGYECQVRPRSGLALKEGISVVNTPGTIDSGYRNECCVILINLSNESAVIEVGERVAQFVFTQVEHPIFEETTKEGLSSSDRGLGGFGHTGVSK
jgi:dUTP pyrophosphatase